MLYLSNTETSCYEPNDLILSDSSDLMSLESKRQFLLLFLTFYFTLEYSWLKMLIVSGVQHSDSVIHIHVSINFLILFPFRLLSNIEQDPCAIQ